MTWTLSTRHPDATQSEPYDDAFYAAQMDGSYESARLYVRHLAQWFSPRSVADVGCGRGTWLKAFKENGAHRLVGFDGPWNRQDNMADAAIAFQGVDLNLPLPGQDGLFDLAMSLEVAEHLEPASAMTFVENLTRLSDVVMFGAAFSGQGGIQHLNEQAHTYWARMFLALGFTPYDLFRPSFWGHPGVKFWYQQNTFLYVRQGAALNQTLIDAGHRPIGNIAFMDCVHPDLYVTKLPNPASEPRDEPFVKKLARRASQGLDRLPARRR